MTYCVSSRTFCTSVCNSLLCSVFELTIAYMVELECKTGLCMPIMHIFKMYVTQCCILNAEFEHLLKGSTSTDASTEDEYMIPGESTQLSSHGEVSAQVEGTTLTKTQYSSIHMLISSLLGLPTGALTYAGHTLHPLTLCWHCSAPEIREFSPEYSNGLLSEMAQEGIKRINVGTELYSAIPCRNVSNTFVYPVINKPLLRHEIEFRVCVHVS